MRLRASNVLVRRPQKWNAQHTDKTELLLESDGRQAIDPRACILSMSWRSCLRLSTHSARVAQTLFTFRRVPTVPMSSQTFSLGSLVGCRSVSPALTRPAKAKPARPMMFTHASDPLLVRQFIRMLTQFGQEMRFKALGIENSQRQHSRTWSANLVHRQFGNAVWFRQLGEPEPGQSARIRTLALVPAPRWASVTS